MKLLTKLNIRYILYSILVFGISSVAIYFILSVIITRQMDEQLSANLQQIETLLNSSSQTELLKPFAEISKIRNAPEKTVFSDTLILNMAEDELEEYRQISSVKTLNNETYRIIIRKSKIESEDLLETLALVTLLAMILLTSTLILVNRKVAKSVWNGFYINLEKMKDFSIKNKEQLTLQPSEIQEFSELNHIVENLTGKILKDFRSQKQFSEDVSHELQTPLAIIISRIESLLGEGNLNTQQVENVNSIYASVRRLSRLNKELILLGKIENNQFNSGETTNLKTMLEEKLNDFSEIIKLKKLSCETDFKNDLRIVIPPALAEILINNLLSNSINHNVKEGKIRIETQPGKLVFYNSGATEIPSPEKLFQRFYKVNSSSNSVGLGLAIVKKICENYSVSIQYSFDNGHIFTLIFPL